mgnify:FL=1
MFHKYPYTDFHELNLDGLIAEWKKFLNEYDDVRNKVTDLETAFNSLKDFVENYFNNLDVQEEINNKLDEMKDDGSLEVLLQSVIDTAQTITLSPTLSVSMYSGIVDVGDYNRPSYLQSACANNDIIYMFFTNTATPGTCICKVFNTAGDPIRTATINGLYHANGADFYDGYIYVATLDSLEIVKLNPSDLSIVSRYQFDRGFRSITFDNDGTCYAGSGGVLYAVDLDNLTYTSHCSLDYANSSYQSGCVRDGWLYEAGVNPSCVYRVNATSGQTSKIYAIDRFVDIYPVGEMESVFNDRVTGKFYVASCAYYNFANYRQGQIFEISFSTNLSPKRIYSGGSVLSAGALYVGANTNGLPNGSADNPFPNLASALSSYVSPACEQYKTFQINLQKDCTDEIFYCRRGSYSLNGNGHKIGQIYAVRADIEITDVICQFNNAGYSNLPYPAYFNSSKVDIDGLTIIDPVGASYTYAVVFSESDGEAFDWDLSGTTKDINMYRSNVLCNPGISDRIWYEAENNPNFYYTTAYAAAMTPAALANVALSGNVEIRCYKGGSYADATFNPGGSYKSAVAIDNNGTAELHVIQQTFTAGSGYTYSVTDSYDISTGATVTPCTLSNQVRFIRRW